MEFVNVGTHCAEQYCKQQDFLPFTCDACNQTFCRDHRTYESHRCSKMPVGNTVFACPMCKKGIPIQPGQDPNLMFEQHMNRGECQSSAVKKCPVPRCKVRLTDVNSIQCSDCRQKFCTAHRFPDTHGCTVQRPQGRSFGYRCQKCPQSFAQTRELIAHYRTNHAKYAS